MVTRRRSEEVRDAVLRHANYKCEKCGKDILGLERGVGWDMHDKRPGETRFIPEKFEALCDGCNSEALLRDVKQRIAYEKKTGV